MKVYSFYISIKGNIERTFKKVEFFWEADLNFLWHWKVCYSFIYLFLAYSFLFYHVFFTFHKICYKVDIMFATFPTNLIDLF